MLLTAWSWAQLLCLLFVLSAWGHGSSVTLFPECFSMPLEAWQGKPQSCAAGILSSDLEEKRIPELTQWCWCLSNTHWPVSASAPLLYSPSAQDETVVSDRKGSLVSPTAWHRPSPLKAFCFQGSPASYHGDDKFEIPDGCWNHWEAWTRCHVFFSRYMHNKVEFEH